MEYPHFLNLNNIVEGTTVLGYEWKFLAYSWYNIIIILVN